MTMEDRSPPSTSNHSGATKGEERKKGKENKRKGEFEFCKVCRINHDDGRRHNYFPRHVKSLSSLFSRFHKKVSEVRSSLKTPRLLLPERTSCDRIWCVFCDIDIDELGGSCERFLTNPFDIVYLVFPPRGNAIRHLASEDHLKSLKHFLWKYGGGMNKVDSFRVTETELLKWEKKCAVLTSEAASIPVKSDGTPHGTSIDIQTNDKIVKHFGKNSVHYVNSNLSNDVKPLQYDTTESYQVSHPDISQVADIGPSMHAFSPCMPLDDQYNSSVTIPTGLAGYYGGQYFLPYDNKSCSYKCPDNGLLSRDQSAQNGTSSSQGLHFTASGLQNLAQVTTRGSTDTKGNVHTGAPPPWFNATEAEKHTIQSCTTGANPALLPPGKSGKSNKLNPKRVGAAWAEKRKIEMEMERRGEIVANDGGADWLPNFGRVWQSGSRRESKKEFEKEKRKLPDVESPPEAPMMIQPYISKRMRSETNKGSPDSDAGDTAEMMPSNPY